MFGKSPAVSELIAREIEASGPISFARFMELALYDPGDGYYASGKVRIGKQGDFFTNVSVGAFFGRLLAGQFVEVWERLGRPDDFTVVEQGAHDGTLAADVLGALVELLPDGFRYLIVEPTSFWRAEQEKNLGRFGGKVGWVGDVPALPRFRGVHFSNELVDALPFHLLQSQGDGWQELMVVRPGEGFAFESAHGGKVPPGLPVRPEGVLLEVRPAASVWLASVAERLDAGMILVIDYGYTRENLWADHRTRGTFSCYSGHRRDDNVLSDPGAKDITSHVDFTQLAGDAIGLGLALEGFADQHHYLVGASERYLRTLEGSAPAGESRKALRNLQTLIHPESMGRQFHYLGLVKDLPPPAMTGFRYARGTTALRESVAALVEQS